MKRIVFVISTMETGGAEKVFYDTALGLYRHKSEYEVSVVCLYGRGEIGKRLSEKGVEVYDRILRHRFDIKGVFKLAGILRRKRPDLFYIAGQTLAQAVSFAASMWVKIPVKIIGVHSHDLVERSLYKSLVDMITFSRAKQIVCVSHSQKLHIAIGKDIPSEKIEVIYNGVDTERFKAGNKKGNGFSVPEGAIVVGVLASLRKEKGIDVLIKAMPDVLRYFPETIFVIAGDGIERQCLEDMAKAGGVYPSIRFLGRKEDVSQIIPIFDIGCLSSRTENFPLSALEYMACEKPVVATRVGGIPEMVRDGVNGLLAEPESPRDLSEKILSLIRDKGLRVSMGREGRKIVEDNFTLRKMIDNYKGLFDKALL